MEGTKNNDELIGTSSDDNINAQAGNDQVEGLAGNDHVAGGNDTLDGGAGSDQLLDDSLLKQKMPNRNIRHFLSFFYLFLMANHLNKVYGFAP